MQREVDFLITGEVAMKAGIVILCTLVPLTSHAGEVVSSNALNNSSATMQSADAVTGQPSNYLHITGKTAGNNPSQINAANRDQSSYSNQTVTRFFSSYTGTGPGTTANGADSWLMLLTGAGLVVLQLRRKQKILPQRPLI